MSQPTAVIIALGLIAALAVIARMLRIGRSVIASTVLAGTAAVLVARVEPVIPVWSKLQDALTIIAVVILAHAFLSLVLWIVGDPRLDATPGQCPRCRHPIVAGASLPNACTECGLPASRWREAESNRLRGPRRIYCAIVHTLLGAVVFSTLAIGIVPLWREERIAVYQSDLGRDSVSVGSVMSVCHANLVYLLPPEHARWILLRIRLGDRSQFAEVRLPDGIPVEDARNNVEVLLEKAGHDPSRAGLVLAESLDAMRIDLGDGDTIHIPPISAGSIRSNIVWRDPGSARSPTLAPIPGHWIAIAGCALLGAFALLPVRLRAGPHPTDQPSA